MNNEAIELLKEEISFTKGCPNTCDRIDAHAHKKGGLKKLLALLQAKPKCETGNEEAIKFWLDAAFKARTMVYTNYCVNKACSLLHKPTCDDWIPVSETTMPDEPTDPEGVPILVTLDSSVGVMWLFPASNWKESIKSIGYTHWKPIVLPKPKCKTCGGSGRKPRKEHCRYSVCRKTYYSITCHPEGIQCEYYIPSEPCPDCQSKEPNPECKTCDGGEICLHNGKANSQFAQNCIDNNYKHYKSCPPKEPEPDAGELKHTEDCAFQLNFGGSPCTCHVKPKLIAKRKVSKEPKPDAGEFVKRLRSNIKSYYATFKSLNVREAIADAVALDLEQAADRIAELPLQVVQDYIKVNQGKVVEGIMTKMAFADKYKINSGIFERLAYALTSPLEEQIAELKAELTEWREKEGSVCPEDVGFVEYIGVLQAKLEAE